MSFETFVYVRTLTLSPPPHLPPPQKKSDLDSLSICKLIKEIPQSPPHSPPPPLRIFIFQIWILCQKKNHLPLPPTATPQDPSTLPPPPSAQFFSDIWILCQLDSVLVIFLQIDNFKWHFFSSRRTTVPNYSEKNMHKYRRYGPDKLNL